MCINSAFWSEMASECVARAITADQEILEQIRLNELEFYGADLPAEEQLPASQMDDDS